MYASPLCSGRDETKCELRMTISQMKPRNFLERIVCFFYIFFFSDRHESAEGFENGVGGFNGNPCLRLFH